MAVPVAENLLPLLDEIFNSPHVLIVYLEPDFKIRRVNRSFTQFYGKGTAALIGQNWFELAPNPDLKALFSGVIKMNRAFFAQGTALVIPGLKHASDQVWDMSIQPVNSEDGATQGVLLGLVNTTQRKRGDENIQQFTERLDTINRLNQLISASFSIYQVFDVLVEHIEGVLPFDWIAIALRSSTGRHWRPVWQWSRAERAIPAGVRLPIEGSVFAFFEEHPEALYEDEVGQIGEFRENHYFQACNLHSRILLPLIIQGELSGLMMLASQDRALYNHSDVALMDSLSNQIAIVMQNASLFEQLQKYSSEVETRIHTQEERIDLLSAQLDKKAVYVEQYERDYGNLTTQIEGFIELMSETLRPPLRLVAGFANLCLESDDNLTAEERILFLNRIRTNAGQMERQVEEMGEYARVCAQPLQRQPVDLALIARQAADQVVAGRAQDSGKINLNITGLPPANGDPALLRQVLYYLIDNAVKFSAETQHPAIEVGWTQINGKNCCFVRDNGAGFDARYAHLLFGLFHRLHDPERFPGTGLSLAAVKNIIEKHGGEVWAHGTIDQGATFYFTLGDAPKD
jgi:PAS domain S-box-containing protein